MRPLPLLALTLVACGGPKPASVAKPTMPALEAPTLAGITQGPGARWAALARPKELFAGALGGPIGTVVPRDGLDRLASLLGFDLRASDEAIYARFAEVGFYAARLPAGSSPEGAIAAFERRAMQPSGRSPTRPDVVRAFGSLPSGERASAAVMYLPGGDVIAGEAGRFGPVEVSIALAGGKLPKARALAQTSPYAPLLRWIGQAPIALLARCPLADLASKADAGPAPALAEECDGAAIAAEPLPQGRLAIRAHVEGHWGADAPLLEKEARAIVARVVAGELGRALDLGAAKVDYASSPTTVEVRAELDAARFAERLHTLISAEITEVTR